MIGLVCTSHCINEKHGTKWKTRMCSDRLFKWHQLQGVYICLWKDQFYSWMKYEVVCFVWLTHESNRNCCLIRASNLRTCHLLNFGIWIINSNMINIPTGAGNILHWLLIRVNSGRLLYGFTDIFTVQRIISLLISIMAFH